MVYQRNMSQSMNEGALVSLSSWMTAPAIVGILVATTVEAYYSNLFVNYGVHFISCRREVSIV